MTTSPRVNLHRALRRGTLVLLDLVLFTVAYACAHLIRMDAWPTDQVRVNVWDDFRATAFTFVLVKSATFLLGGSYRSLQQYATVGDLLVLARNTTLASMSGLFVVGFFYQFRGYSRGVLAIDWMLTLFLVSAVRLVWRMAREGAFDLRRGPQPHRRVLIVGAGRTGLALAKDLTSTFRRDLTLVGFVDDNAEKQGSSLLGRPILGGSDDLRDLIGRWRIDQVIVAIPNVSPRLVRELAERCREAREFRVIPSLDAILSGKVPITQTLPVAPEVFLPRDRVDLLTVERFFAGKVVMVTGAGGSIGSELARQLSRPEVQVARLVLLDAAETPLFDIDRAVRDALGPRAVAVLASVRDEAAMREALARHRPDVVLHAAALKHVPLSETHPIEAIHTNTVATTRLARLCSEQGVGMFVLVSTDKAVAPSSVMGASKRGAEVCVRALGSAGPTRFVTVRFGNVLGSNGSVLPVFHEQITRGGPLTVTDPRMTRFFMTIPEACGLILHATSFAHGGEIFVLDMGEPVRILDLANNLIRFYGYEPGRDIEVRFTGLRPGEKLHEALLDEGETPARSTHPKILCIPPAAGAGPRAMETLARLEAAVAARDEGAALAALREMVPTFDPEPHRRVEPWSPEIAPAEAPPEAPPLGLATPGPTRA